MFSKFIDVAVGFQPRFLFGQSLKDIPIESFRLLAFRYA